jgi:hypothetical protein
MTPAGKCRKFQAEGTWPRRALPCRVPESTFQTPPKASRVQKICPRRRSFDAVATIHTSLVPNAVGRVLDIAPAPGCCTTWAIWFTGGPAISNWFTRSTAAPSAASASTRTCPTTPGPSPTTRIVSSHSRYGLSSRTAYPIRPPVGTSGAITACSSPSPPSRTGWRPGGKKAARQMWTSYLDSCQAIGERFNSQTATELI